MPGSAAAGALRREALRRGALCWGRTTARGVQSSFLLLVWAQMWAEKRNESPAAAKRLYYAWSCELAHLHAKYLARCIMAHARRSSEVADDKLGQDAC